MSVNYTATISINYTTEDCEEGLFCVQGHLIFG